MKESCAIKSVSKTPGTSNEGIERRTTDPFQRPAIHQSDEIGADDSEEQEGSIYQSVQGTDTVTDGEDAKEEDPSSPLVYYHEGGELLREEVEQHLAVLPEVATSSTEITIGDVQVGDPGVTLTKDQERVRQSIWKNKHLLMGKVNTLPHAARGLYEISMSRARIRLHSVYGRWHLIFGRNWQVQSRDCCRPKLFDLRYRHGRRP